MPYKKLFPEIYTAAECLQILGGCAKQSFDKKINLLVWNMYKGRNKGWEHDFLPLIQGRDLVFLQESILHTKHDQMFDSLDRFEWVMARTHKDRTTFAATGVKTGSVVPSLAQKFFISPDSEPILKTPKMLLATTYPIAGGTGTLLVINIHAINFVSFEKFNRQMAQLVEALENHNGPLILAGDFNTWNVGRHKSLRDITQRMGLKEAILTRKGRLMHMNQHLDHVFYRDMELESASVMPHIRSSDHYPIEATFVL